MDPSQLTLPQYDLTVLQHTRDPNLRRENVLYLPARRIAAHEFASPELYSLLEAMKNLMRATGGIGIAANQVGKRVQAFLIEARPGNPRYQVLGEVPFQAFLNPRILVASASRRNFWHGCLSAAGEPRGNVSTYEWIEIEAQDETGNLFKCRLSGLAAVIFQHELRHLLGGTYLDRATTFLAKAELDEKLDSREIAFFDPVGEELPHLLGDYLVGESLEDYYRRQSGV